MNWMDICAAGLIVWAFLIVILITDWLVAVFHYNRKG